MVKRGTVMLNYQPLPDQKLVNFFRATVTCHPSMTKNDVIEFIEELEDLAKEL